jgi:carboxypeptidase Q
MAFLALLCVCMAVSVAAEERPHSSELATAYADEAQQLIGAALTSDDAWLRLSELCDGIGNRLSGSKALDEAIDWAAECMRQDGLDVTLQPVMVPHWTRGDESLQMLAPRRQSLSMVGLGNSVGTPRRGIEADVVVVHSWEELAALPDEAVRGHMVLYNVPFTSYGKTVKYRGSGCDSASARGGVAALVRSVGPVSLDTPHTGALRYADSTVTRIPGAAVSIEVAEMIDRLTSRGVGVRLKLNMQAHMADKKVLSHNVIGELRGAEKPDEVVVIGGHLDSWDVGQGAHDDGGGCVISMEALRLIHALGLRPRRTIRVVLWTNEENGLEGGKAYRDSLGANVGSHVAALETDGGVERLLGFGASATLEDGREIDAPRQARVQARLRQIAPLLAGLGGDRVLEHGGGADISPLMKAGVPGLAHRTVMETYFHIHHTQADAMDKVDPVELRKNVAAMAVMTWVLADMPERLDDPLPGE